MEKTYVMPDDKAEVLKQQINNDLSKGYFELFPIVRKIILSIIFAIEDKLPFTYEQDCTLRANGYTKGVVADWYYPHWDNGCNIIRKK
jgi:hypothetical protein